ncbi:MAG TPA: hypothetical protein VLG50_04315 [Candidatus Saccharimonadales bacterium]|nr:hypothetical protein [Candidatus Saccharimonadales bacterium]
MKKYSIAFLMYFIPFQLMSSEQNKPNTARQGTPPAQKQASALTPAQQKKLYSSKTSDQERSTLLNTTKK